jgi:hypothetical protein
MLGHRRPFRVPSPAAGRSRIPAHRNMLTCQRGGASEKTWCGLAVCASYIPRPTTLSGKYAVASVSNSGRNRRDGNHPGWSRLPAVSSWLSMRGVPLEARLTQIPLLQLTPRASAAPHSPPVGVVRSAVSTPRESASSTASSWVNDRPLHHATEKSSSPSAARNPSMIGSR